MATTAPAGRHPRAVHRARTGEVLRLEHAKPHGRGGEAIVVGVPSAPHLVAKIYHRDRLSPRARAEREAKLRAMLAAPPASGGPRPSVAWPVDLLHDASSGAFVGFVMPRVAGGLLWHQLADPIDRLRQAPGASLDFLLAAAANLCDAVAAVHAAGHVVGDVNPNNALVHRDALVTLVDADSFQVATPGGRFPCPAGMPPYVAPEVVTAAGARGDYSAVTRSTASDAWGVAVLVHELLTGGVDPTTTVTPASAPQWGGGVHPADALAPGLRALFVRCFGAGHGAPAARPTVIEWARACRAAAQDLVTCAATQTHRYGRHLAACPHCAHRAATGIDLFPEVAVVRSGRQLQPGGWRVGGASTRRGQASRQGTPPGRGPHVPVRSGPAGAPPQPGAAPAARPAAAPSPPTNPARRRPSTSNRGFMLAVTILLMLVVLRAAYRPAEMPTVWLAAAAAAAATWAALRPPPGRGRAPGALALVVSAILARHGAQEGRWLTRQPWRAVAELAWAAHVPAPIAARLGEPRGVALARAALAGGDTAGAQIILTRTLATRPDAAAAHAVAGRIALAQSRLGVAQAALARSLDLAQWDPAVSPGSLLLLARTVCRRGDTDLGTRLLGHAHHHLTTTSPEATARVAGECRAADRPAGRPAGVARRARD